MGRDLDIVIPAREEEFVSNTITDILANRTADTGVIAVLDGYWPDPPILDDPRVTIIHMPEPVGQRAAVNVGARMSTAKYIAKSDAHCAFAKGFDTDLLAVIRDDWTMAPRMRNLHIFDWVCPNGHRRYQGKSGPCAQCGAPTVKEIVWIAKTNPQNASFRFDSEPHFQYFGEYSRRPEGHGHITESMSLQGSFFMTSRERYFDLNLCDEEFGSWGSQGIEVACKSWLSGGKVMVNNDTWYAHCFRTQGGDFGFPYPLSGKQVQKAKEHARNLFFNNLWPRQIYPLSWLVERFKPVPGWTDAEIDAVRNMPVKENSLSKGIIYYTDNRLDPDIMLACQKQLSRSAEGIPVVSVSLAPISFGDNVVLNKERGYLTMFLQILTALKLSKADVVYFCEHDVLYHKSHFDFVPPKPDVFYYNHNNWKVRASDGQALYFICEQTLGLACYRKLALEHYETRVERVAREGFHRSMGFEPGKHKFPRGVDNYGWDWWESEGANIDIRHDKNLTESRWRQDQFRDQRNCQGWKMSDEVPGWGLTKGRFSSIIADIISNHM